jgi:2-(1,2-epoxy-1,2-dihydrophenyl)acetyl-CoA isomerase
MPHAETTEAEILTRLEGGVSWITLNRPHRLNAFAGSMREELAQAVERSSGDSEVRAIVIAGTGRSFCAGADVDVMVEMLDREDEESFRRNVEAGMRAVRAIAAAPQPVIAAVNGVAVGAGASLAIACDLRIASESARIGFTFNRIGLHPDWGATHFLPRLVGTGRAGELILTARVLDAPGAAQLGIFDEVVPEDAHISRVAEIALEMAGRAPLAIRTAKTSLAAATGGPAALEDALRREAEAQMLCFRSRDVREGIAAFREKRAPDFLGR